jgi:hypothetical protein
VKEFLNDLIEEKGWKAKNVNLKEFAESLNEYAMLSYEEGKFAMKEHDESKPRFKQASITK